MTPQDLVKLVEGIIVVAGVTAVAYAVFRNSTVKQTINSQKELIGTLTTQVNELRTLHIENEKAISKLSGQVEVYKELPLSKIAESMEHMLTTQKEILKLIKNKA